MAINTSAAGGNLLIRRERDLRIDLARGLALLIIFVDHNASLRSAFGWLTSYTLGRYSFIDASDGFFLISGYVSGIVYTNVFQSQGFVACLRKALKRCLHLYIAEISLFLVCSALICLAPIYTTSAPWLAFHHLRDLPGDTLRDISPSKGPPPFFGLLPMYAIFIGLTPIALWLRIHRPIILVLLSVGLYLTAQSASGLHVYTTYGDGFNLFAWQLVFVGGILIGFKRSGNPGRGWRPSPKVVTAAIVGLLLIAFLRVAPSPKFGALLHTTLLGHVVPQAILLTKKQNAEPLRLVNLFLWLIVVAAVNPACRFFRHWVVRIPIVCGQNALLVFCVSVFLNYVMLIYASAVSGSIALQVAWNVIGCGALVATAAGWKWLTSRIPSYVQDEPHTYGFTPYLKASFHYLGALVYTIWQGFEGLLGGRFDV